MWSLTFLITTYINIFILYVETTIIMCRLHIFFWFSSNIYTTTTILITNKTNVSSKCRTGPQACSALLGMSIIRGVNGYTLLVCVAIFSKWSGVATLLMRLSFCQNKPIARTPLDFRILSLSIINMSWSEKSLPAQIPFVHCTLYMVVVCTIPNISGQNRLRPCRTPRSIQPHPRSEDEAASDPPSNQEKEGGELLSAEKPKPKESEPPSDPIRLPIEAQSPLTQRQLSQLPFTAGILPEKREGP